MINSEIQFSAIYYLWLLIPLWLYLSLYFQSKKADQHFSMVEDQHYFYHPLAEQLINNEQKNANNINQKKTLKFWKRIDFWWQGIAISALIMALAEPILIGERLPDPPPERDIVFLVDTSVSMQLKDYSVGGKPIKRMDLLRNLLDEFATKMKGEHISVIIFAEQPYMLVPLTHDQYLIRRMLNRVTTTLAGRYTAVGDALLMALKEANKQKKRHQTFIVFTDADESHGKVTPEAAAKLVAERDIPVFTIAIGSSQKNKNEKVQGGLYQAVNLPLLENIAKITEGKSYQVHDSQAIEKALESILSQRQNLAKPIPQYQRETLYLYPLFFGLLLLMLLQAYRLLESQFEIRHA